MTLDEIAARAKKGKPGPKTDAGKWRSAVNAVKHGMLAKHLLLPGEDPQAYTQKMDAIFCTLAPENEAEAELVALVGDDLHRLDRLARVEKGLTLGRIEELLALTSTAEKGAATANAINALGSALTRWCTAPTPTTTDAEFTRRLRSMTEAVGFVEATVAAVPANLIEACDTLLAQLHELESAPVPADIYVKTFDAARVLLTFLLAKGKAEDAAQDELRAAITGIALPDEAELRKLGRYRKILEDSLQRRLAALEQLRKLTAERREAGAGPDKAKEYRVRLRVVA